MRKTMEIHFFLIFDFANSLISFGKTNSYSPQRVYLSIGVIKCTQDLNNQVLLCRNSLISCDIFLRMISRKNKRY